MNGWSHAVGWLSKRLRLSFCGQLGGAVPNVPSDEEFRAYNEGVISEFRANRGVVSEPAFPILLLTTTGARTGRPATVPLGFAVDDSGRVFVVASKAGAPTQPAW